MLQENKKLYLAIGLREERFISIILKKSKQVKTSKLTIAKKLLIFIDSTESIQ